MLSDKIDLQADGLLDSFFPGLGPGTGSKIWHDVTFQLCQDIGPALEDHVMSLPLPSEPGTQVYNLVPKGLFATVAKKLDYEFPGITDVQKAAMYYVICRSLMNIAQHAMQDRLDLQAVNLKTKRHLRIDLNDFEQNQKTPFEWLKAENVNTTNNGSKL